MLEEIKEEFREYLKTHKTDSQQKLGKLALEILNFPYLIPDADPYDIKVMLIILGYDVSKREAAYDELIKEIKERENKVYRFVDIEKIEKYR